MKKLLVLILSVVAACTAMLSLAACDNSSNSGGGTTVTDGDKSNDDNNGGSGSETGGGSQGGSGSETGGGSQGGSGSETGGGSQGGSGSETGGGSGETPEHTTHTYDQEVAEAKYLATEATCTKKATYYYSCVCGEKGTETFESGALADHPYNDEWFSDDDNHYRKSTCTHAVVKDEAAHTYNANGVCTVCNRRKPSEGLYYVYNPGNGEYAVSNIGTCSDANIVIPSTYNGKPVTSLAETAFRGCSSITSVTLGDNVKVIDDDAFTDCDSLTFNEYDNACYIGTVSNPYLALIKAKSSDITTCKISEDCKIIYKGAFDGCSSLSYNKTNGGCYLGSEDNEYYALIKASSTTVEECRIKDGCKIVNNSAFRYCTSLIGVTVPDSVETIGNSAFFGCSALRILTLGNGVKIIGDHAFSRCVFNTVTIPDSTEIIGDFAFV